MMFQTKRADWYFIIPATLVWMASLLVTAWDFIVIQRIFYRFGIENFVGVLLIIIGVAIRRLAKRTLGRYFSSGLKIQENHMLIKHGIYKHIRHPAYSGVLLTWAGVPLMFSSLYGFSFTLLLIPCYIYRIKIEEGMLLRKFGDEYLEYMKTTKRLIPYLY